MQKKLMLLISLGIFSCAFEQGACDILPHDIRCEVIRQIVNISASGVAAGKNIRTLQVLSKSWNKVVNQFFLSFIGAISERFSISASLSALSLGTKEARSWADSHIVQLPKEIVSKDLDYAVATFGWFDSNQDVKDLSSIDPFYHHKKNIFKYLADHAAELRYGKKRIPLGNFSRLEIDGGTGINISFYENKTLRENLSSGDLSIHFVVVSPEKFLFVIDSNVSIEWIEYSLMKKYDLCMADRWISGTAECENSFSPFNRKRRIFCFGDSIFFYYWYTSLGKLHMVVLQGNTNDHDVSRLSLEI